MGWLGRCWRGEEELWKVIWIYGAFFIFLSRVTVVALRLLCDVDLDKPTPDESTFLVGLEALYCLWMLVSLWRCAFVADWSIWGYFIRTFVILYVLLFCMFSCLVGKAVEPKDVIVKSGILLQWQAGKWLKSNEPDHRTAPDRGLNSPNV